ncbi:MAG: hypothetical protein BIFFINMI_01119 [Phycisphaerae bacterium]|nr:hypothetical protein [Phycisphaerae bacterium]
MELEPQGRENWGTRAGFVLAAIGSAVGLGNLWGFPYKLYSYGGGAFLIPYVIAMVLVGLPLMIVEFSLGHMSQRAAPDALRHVNRRAEFVGWWQILLSFVIITYYAVILAWCISFLGYSIKGIFAHGGQLPWAGEGMAGVKKAREFFFGQYLHQTDGPALGSLQWPIIAALVVTWLFMYLCVFRGVKLVSKVVLWTVPLPWLMLLILTVRGLTLTGADRGLEFYLEPHWAQLAKPETWRWAFGQTFFSLSLAFGVMITYASFLHRKSDLNNNAAIIGLADLGTSFVAGLAVFATLGAMSYASALAGHPTPVGKVVDQGPSLAFVAFPYALAQLPYSAWFSLVFFIALLTLGIDSAFSITESVIAGIVDKTGWTRGKVVLTVHVVGLALGLIYCTQGGLTWLGTMDDFINGPYGIALLGLIECLVVGWLFRLDRLRGHANERSDWKLGRWWNVLVRGVIPIVLSALIAWSLYDNMSSPSGYVRSYASDPVAIAVPATPGIGEKQSLQLQIGDKTVTLSDADAKSRDGWEVTGYGGSFTKLGAEGSVAAAAPTGLRYTARGLPPATKLTPRYRWTADPDLGTESYTDLSAVTTTRRPAGWNIPNLVGVIIFALAPLVAIAFALIRFRHSPTELTQADRPADRAGSSGLALLLALAAVTLTIVAFKPILGISADSRLGIAPDAGTVRMAAGLLAAAVAAGILALVLSGSALKRSESGGRRPSPFTQFGGMLGNIGLGAGLGMGLALLTLVHPFEGGKAVRDQQLSVTSYVMMGLGFALIVGGLFWCFFRAFKSATSAEEQLPET